MVNQLLKTTLRTKLVLIVAGLIGVISVFIYIYFPTRLEKVQMSSMETKAQQISRVIAYGATPALYFEDRDALNEIFAALLQYEELLWIQVLRPDSTVFVEYRRQPDNAAEIKLQKPSSPPEFLTVVQAMEYNDRKIGQLCTRFSLKTLEAEVRLSRFRIALISVSLFLFGVVAITILSRIFTRPLKRMVRTVEQIIAGNLEERMKINTDDEIGFLAREFDNMMERLSAAYRKLDDLNEELEIRVESPTAALRLTNVQLTAELAERKKIERELSAERIRLITMLRKISEAVIITNLENRVSIINRVAAEITGWNEIDAIGKLVADILKLPASPRHQKTAQTIHEFIREQTGENSAYLTILDSQSREKRLSINIVPIRTLFGEKSGTVFIFQLSDEPSGSGLSDLKEYQA